MYFVFSEALQMAAPSDISGLPITVDQKELLINAVSKLLLVKENIVLYIINKIQ